MSEEQIANWVERRALRDRVLSQRSVEIWNRFKAAIHEACDSYNRHYPFSADEEPVRIELDNDERIAVAHTAPADRRQSFRPLITNILVVFEPQTLTIIATRTPKEQRILFRIGASEREAFLCNDRGERITEDAASENSFAGTFFPEHFRRRAVFIEPV